LIFIWQKKESEAIIVKDGKLRRGRIKTSNDGD
jgi:hypothetical protein